MTVFEIVVQQLDTVMGMMYLGADNSTIDCRGTVAIHSYSQLSDLLRCNLKMLCRKFIVSKVTVKLKE